MGRPSVAAERKRQIVEATLRCLGTHGFAGTTLDRIADEAGMSRGHVRHFAGNREELLVDAARGFYAVDEQPPALTSILPDGTGSLAAALDYLFGDFAVPDSDNPTALALVEAARAIPDVRPILIAAYIGSIGVIESLIAIEVPDASASERHQAAYGVLTLALGNVFLGDIEVSAERTALGRAVADQLIDALAARPAGR